jgi:hypothetical protein
VEVTRFDFALAQLRVNPAKVKSFPVSEHPSGTRARLLRSIPTNFIRRVGRYKSAITLGEILKDNYPRLHLSLYLFSSSSRY